MNGRGGFLSVFFGLFVLLIVLISQLLVYALIGASVLLTLLGVVIHTVYRHYRPAPESAEQQIARDPSRWPRPSMSEIIRK